MKINGVFEIEAPIKPDRDYSIALERIALQYTNTRETGEDKAVTYVMANQGIATIIDAGEVIKAKPAKFTQSQMLRMVIEQNWHDQHSGNKEQYYNQRMTEIIERERRLYN